MNAYTIVLPTKVKPRFFRSLETRSESSVRAGQPPRSAILLCTGLPFTCAQMYVSNEPNSVGPPWSFRATGEAVAGAVYIYYSSGAWDLGPDDALVMEGTFPPSRFTNVVLWNVHMQTLDYRTRRNALNQPQIVPEADGTYRIVISARDPGVPNWLDTAGHRRGTIFWRFLLPDEQPETPRCRVVNVSELRA